MRFLLSLLLACAMPATAQEIRPFDEDRLAQFDAVFGQAMRGALSSGRRGDIDRLQDALAGTALPPFETTLTGDWSCRMIKMGGLLPLTVYAPFACRITPDGPQFQLDKLTGSQLMQGTIQLRDGQMIYLGTGYVSDVTPVPYAELDPDFEGSGEIYPQVGIVEQTGPDTARILLPAPVNESLFNVLVLSR